MKEKRKIVWKNGCGLKKIGVANIFIYSLKNEMFDFRSFMSKLRGLELITKEKIDLDKLGVVPCIKWNKTKREFVFKVPSVYEIVRCGIVADVSGEIVYISEVDMWRLLTADRGDMGFSFVEEQGDLDDSTYLGVSLVQAGWYVSKNVLDVARRTSKRIGYPQWIELKRRVPRGGRKKGSVFVKTLSVDEEKRLIWLSDNYEQIRSNCVKHDWFDEFCDLEKDVKKYKGEKCPSRKELYKIFSQLKEQN